MLWPPASARERSGVEYNLRNRVFQVIDVAENVRRVEVSLNVRLLERLNLCTEQMGEVEVAT